MQNGSGGAQWESLPVDLIERIGAARPAGAVYGSDALDGRGAGVYCAELPVQPFVGVGAGEYGSRKPRPASAAPRVWWITRWALCRSHGFDSKHRGVHNEDRDGYTRKSANARVGCS